MLKFKIFNLLGISIIFCVSLLIINLVSDVKPDHQQSSRILIADGHGGYGNGHGFWGGNGNGHGFFGRGNNGHGGG